MRSLAHTVPSRLVIPFGVWFSFNFGNTLFNLLFRFCSDSHSHCHSSYSKLLILFPKSKATIVFEASFSDRASFAASSEDEGNIAKIDAHRAPPQRLLKVRS